MVANLRSLRLSKGISQQQLADVIGTTQQSINKYENHSTEPDFETLGKLADYFDTTVDHLIGHQVRDISSGQDAPMLTRAEQEMLEGYRRLSRTEQESIRLIIKNYLRNQ